MLRKTRKAWTTRRTSIDEIRRGSGVYTLQATNMSNLGERKLSTHKCRLRGDMLVPRKVFGGHKLIGSHWQEHLVRHQCLCVCKCHIVLVFCGWGKNIWILQRIMYISAPAITFKKKRVSLNTPDLKETARRASTTTCYLLEVMNQNYYQNIWNKRQDMFLF